MSAGLYAISMPVAEIIEYMGLIERAVSEMPVSVGDWAALRRDVREGQEVLLVGGVPEDPQAIQLHGLVSEFRDDLQVVMVIV